jgi:cytochrome P450
VKAILHDPKRFSSVSNTDPVEDLVPAARAILEQGPYKHALASSLISTDPPQHTRLRASLTRTFSAQRLARYEPLVRRCASQLIDQFHNQGQVDVVERFNYPFPLLVIFNLIGVPETDLEQVHAWCNAWSTLNFSRPSAEHQVAYAHSAVAFQRYMDALIEQRRTTPQNDLISDLLTAIADGEAHLSQEELFAQIFLLILAGHETTASFLGNCLLYLLRHSSLWQHLLDDPKVISGVVEELLRIDGSVLGLFRTTTETVEIGGISLSAGERVMILYGSANHDETQFPDPEAFLLQRPNQTRHMGLGSGIHFCLGAPLARMESRIALELLSSRFPNLRLVPDQALNYKPNTSGRSLARLLIEWDTQ